jgi:DNA-binding beta-propeller fold protein YncE
MMHRWSRPALGALVLFGAFAGASAGAAVRTAPPQMAFVRNYNSVTPVLIFGRRAHATIPMPVFSNSQTPATSGVAITPNGRTAYVASEDNIGDVDTVTPIDVRTRTVGDPITVGQFPSGLAVTPNGRTVYVVDSGFGPNGSVTPIATSTNTPGSAIPVDAAAGPIAISPDGRTAWVVSQVAGTGPAPTIYLTAIDTATKTAGPRFKVGRGFPQGMTITPNGRTLYISNYLGSVIPVTLATRTVGTPIGIIGSPAGIGVDPTGTTVDVVDSSNGRVIPISTATGTKGPAVHVGLDPWGLAWGPAGKTLWVINVNAVAGEVGGSLIPVTGRIVAPGIPVGAAPDSVAITPDQAPVARFKAAPARHGRPTRFDASASFARSSAIATYTWHFGDGRSATTGSPVIRHTYAAAGTYRVILRLTDRAGTSIVRVFTGQTVLRNGGPAARTSARLTIR